MHGAVIPGYLFDADQYDYSIFSRWEYNYATKTYEYSGQSWEKTNIGPIHDNLIWVTFEPKDYGTLYKPDSIISVQFIPIDNTKFDIVHAFFYIRSPYTVINDGVLNTDNTFSGDYALITNDNKNNDFWKDAYDKLFTVESGEIKNKIDNFIENTQLEDFNDLAIDEQILGILDQEPNDFIIEWDNIYLPNLKENSTIKLISGDAINFSALVRENQRTK